MKFCLWRCSGALGGVCLQPLGALGRPRPPLAPWCFQLLFCSHRGRRSCSVAASVWWKLCLLESPGSRSGASALPDGPPCVGRPPSPEPPTLASHWFPSLQPCNPVRSCTATLAPALDIFMKHRLVTNLNEGDQQSCPIRRQHIHLLYWF